MPSHPQALKTFLAWCMCGEIRKIACPQPLCSLRSAVTMQPLACHSPTCRKDMVSRQNCPRCKFSPRQFGIVLGGKLLSAELMTVCHSADRVIACLYQHSSPKNEDCRIGWPSSSIASCAGGLRPGKQPASCYHAAWLIDIFILQADFIYAKRLFDNLPYAMMLPG